MLRFNVQPGTQQVISFRKQAADYHNYYVFSPAFFRRGKWKWEKVAAASFCELFRRIGATSIQCCGDGQRRRWCRWRGDDSTTRGGAGRTHAMTTVTPSTCHTRAAAAAAAAVTAANERDCLISDARRIKLASSRASPNSREVTHYLS